MFPVNSIIQFVVILGWVFVSLWNSHVEILTPKVIVWGGWALRWWWGHERGAPMNGISVLIKKKTPRELPQPFLHGRTQWKHSPPPRTELYQSLTILTPSSQISGLQNCRKYISIAEVPILIFCYGSPSIPRQHPSVPGFSHWASYVQDECQDERVQSWVRPCCIECHCSTPFQGQVIFQCVDGPHYVYLFSIHLWMVIWVISTFQLLWIVLLGTFMYKYFRGHVFLSRVYMWECKYWVTWWLHVWHFEKLPN